MLTTVSPSLLSIRRVRVGPGADVSSFAQEADPVSKARVGPFFMRLSRGDVMLAPPLGPTQTT